MRRAIITADHGQRIASCLYRIYEENWKYYGVDADESMKLMFARSYS